MEMRYRGVEIREAWFMAEKNGRSSVLGMRFRDISGDTIAAREFISFAGDVFFGVIFVTVN